MKISIIIPVFNEENTIEKLLEKVIKADVFGYEKEIIIVDDGSEDNSRLIIKNVISKYKSENLKLITHKKNQGKGAAIRTGLKYITGDIVIIQDADLEYNPKDYKNLLKAFNKGFPVVYGSRNLYKKKRGYFLYYLGGWLITILFNMLFGTNLTDITTGYKLFRADIIKNINLKSDGFEFCEEVTAKVLKSGYFIKEVPIDYSPRKFSEGKKIRAIDGLKAIWSVIYWRFKG